MSSSPGVRPCDRIAVLVVDDEDSFRIGLAGMLREDGHAVTDYRSPLELPPLEALSDVALLVTDYDMPGRNGLSLADAFHAAHPAAPVVMVTAYAVDPQAERRAFLHVVSKPLEYDALHALIHRLVR